MCYKHSLSLSLFRYLSIHFNLFHLLFPLPNQIFDSTEEKENPIFEISLDNRDEFLESLELDLSSRIRKERGIQ